MRCVARQMAGSLELEPKRFAVIVAAFALAIANASIIGIAAIALGVAIAFAVVAAMSSRWHC